MRYRKEIITTVGTLGCAVGIGFMMQQSASPREIPVEYQGVALTNADAAVLDVEEIILTSAEFSDAIAAPKPEEVVALAAMPTIVAPDADVLEESVTEVVADDVVEFDSADDITADLAPVCDITANARPIAAAMVNLTLSAPCYPMERIAVQHAGLLFNQLTDENGSLDITVPAMAQDAVFVVAFTNGDGAVAQTVVEELSDFHRVALQWKGDTGFQLHAREFGAEYDSAGHVWSGEMRSMSYAATGQGGYIARLGDEAMADGLMAEVYTFPASAADIYGDVDLSIETEVGSNNCGLEIEAQTLQTVRGNDITTRNLTMSVPDCDASGNFLVLNNLFEDLKVAIN
ncbi:MAG: hypothetical protein WBG95_03565 [Sulfitobacter sp.]